MKNSKDKSIIRLLLLFVAYYLITFHMPNIFSNAGKLINMIVRDIVMIIVAVLIYYKDVSKDFRKFKRSKNKWIILLWAIGIIGVWYLITYLSNKYLSSSYDITSDSKNISALSYYKLSKTYAFFKVIIYTGIIETILFNLSFRKVFNNNIIFIIISSLVFAFFNQLFIGFNTNIIISLMVLRFVPCVLYNIAYIKNDNNIVSLMAIVIICNIIPFLIILAK